MTERQILYWIKGNLSSYISQALKPPYTIEWISAMVMRETGWKIGKWADKVFAKDMHALMRGDYSQREGEKEASYHGYGYMQIDVDSYPDFVKSGDWKDPLKTFVKSIQVLDEKMNYLKSKLPDLKEDDLYRATTAAYNCGQGNVVKAIRLGFDVDHYTFNHDYVKEVWRFKSVFQTL